MVAGIKYNKTYYSDRDLNYARQSISFMEKSNWKDAKKVAKHLALKYGLFVGISAGANVLASFKWLRDNNKTNAVTILCDRGERYLSCL